MQISQQILLKGKRTVRVLADDTVHIEIQSDGAISEFSVPLGILDASTVRQKQPASKFILGCVVCAFLFVGTLVARPFVTDEGGRIVLGILAFLMILPLGFSFYRFWRHTYDFTAFCARESGQTVFTLFTDIPNAAEFQKFVGALRKRITETQGPSPATDSTAHQLQSFARLKEQGILTEEEFAKIKERLLDAVGLENRRIGFTGDDRN